MPDKLIAGGACANEEEAIERALKTLVTAVTREPSKLSLGNQMKAFSAKLTPPTGRLADRCMIYIDG